VARFRHLGIGLGIVAAFAAGMAAASVGGYPGGPDECIALGDCYCEAIGSGRMAQPVNAWSNAAFVVAGLIVLADHRRRGSAPMAVDGAYPLLYGIVVILIGLGSFAFHGTMRAWGGAVDLVAMYAYVAFFIGYGLVRIAGWGRGRFLTVTALLTAAPSLALAVIPPQHGKWVFAGMVGVALLVETAVAAPALRPWWPGTVEHRRWPWFWAGLGSFGLAFVVWNLSRTGGPWCDPGSLIQGHALWHLLGAAATWCFYRYFLTSSAAQRPGSVGGGTVGVEAQGGER
jgi:hypothetical protein